VDSKDPEARLLLIGRSGVPTQAFTSIIHGVGSRAVVIVASSNLLFTSLAAVCALRG
jgi:hypothetical protein